MISCLAISSSILRSAISSSPPRYVSCSLFISHSLPALSHIVVQFFDVAFRQRACREFTDDWATDEELERIMLAATFAPSAMNPPSGAFVVVRNF